jgi:hypothetical protein
MGEGLKRAAAAAQATQLEGEDAREMRSFLHTIDFHYEGAATSSECPTATRAQDRVRKMAKRRAWVTYEGGYWRITDAGRAALRNL